MKRILSYLIPIKMKTYSSKLSGPLEITYLNGRKVLDSKNANYSYGALQQVLHQGLRHIGFGSHIRNILVLGMGGGSVVESIREDFGSPAEITLVEIDPEMIRLAKEEFDIERYGGLEIVEADALEFVKKNSRQFDLVVVDLFIHDRIPSEFTEPDFLAKLPELLSKKGRLVFNTMRRSLPEDTRKRMLAVLEEQGLQVSVLEGVVGYNDLLLGTKN